MENVTPKNEKSISGAIKINEKEIVDHLNQLVRQSVEDTINSLLDADAELPELRKCPIYFSAPPPDSDPSVPAMYAAFHHPDGGC